MKLSPEVMMYIQNVKSFFNKNEEAKKYFFFHYDEETFYKKLSEISQSNFNDKGDAMLTLEQFEMLRNPIEKKYTDDGFMGQINKNIFIEFNGYEKICLN